MLFCQHKHSTWDMLGTDWLNIHDTPHYKHLQGGGEYRQYLRAAWKGRRDKIDSRIAAFDTLLTDIRTNGVQSPVQVVKRFNGDDLVFHGNHRYAIARHLGLECPVEYIGVDEYIRFNIENRKYRFGTNDEGIPYQSLWYKGECLVEGRRKDQLDRHSLIDPLDLAGKRVYDFGSNIGASAFLAHESGATVEGWDSAEFRTTAIRLAVLFNYDIRYKKPSGVYDTLFLFSVHAHAEIPDIKARVIYIETHEDGKLPERFKESELRGKLGKRKLWRYDNTKNCS